MSWLLSIALGATLYVPGDHATLADACQAAQDGDTVHVDHTKSGYSTHADYCAVSNMTLSLVGANPNTPVGPIFIEDATVDVKDLMITGLGGSGALVVRHATLTGDGLTLQSGLAGQGLVVTQGSSVTLTGFSASGFKTTAPVSVGAATGSDTDLVLRACTLSDNTKGAINAIGGAPLQITLNACEVKNNGAGSTAGGALLTAGSQVKVTVDGGTWSNNQASSSGGAISTSGDLTLTGGVVLRENAAPAGAAVWHKSGDLVIASATFQGNRSGDPGAALLTTSPSRFDVLDAHFVENTNESAAPGPAGMVATQLPSGSLVQYSRFCGNGATEPASAPFTNALALSGTGSIGVVRSVFDQNVGGERAATLSLSGGAAFLFEHNTFAGNGDQGATLALTDGTLEFVNNFIDGDQAAWTISQVEHRNNAFRGRAPPSGWTTSFEITDPDYLGYSTTSGCDFVPAIGEDSELKDRGSEDVGAVNVADSGLPDVGAYYVEGGGDTGQDTGADTGDTGVLDTGDPPETGLDTATPDSGQELTGWSPGGASGGCSPTGGHPLLLSALLAMLAGRRGSGGCGPGAPRRGPGRR